MSGERPRQRSSAVGLAVAIAAVLLTTLAPPVAAADATAPSVTTPVLSATSVAQGTPVGLSTSASDPSGVAAVQARVDGGSWFRMNPGLSGSVTSPRSATAVLNVGILHVRAGGQFTCVIASDTTVRCWGANGSKQLGDGTTNGSVLPIKVS